MGRQSQDTTARCGSVGLPSFSYRLKKNTTSVLDPHRLYADPDPALKMNADPCGSESGYVKNIILSRSKNVKF
jgi:hypothetical protein